MKNINNFKKQMTMYLLNFSFEDKESYILLMANFLKDKVSDEEFSRAVENIMQLSNDEYFEKFKGKRLSVADWLKLCGKISKNQQIENMQEKALNEFLKKVRYYWDGHLLESERKEMLKAFNSFEKHILSLNGNIGGIRQDLLNHTNGVFGGKTKAMITAKLTKDFKDNYGKETEVLELNDSVKNLLPKFNGG